MTKRKRNVTFRSLNRKQRNFEKKNAMKATETPILLSNMQIEAEEEICKDALNKACAQYTDFNYFFFSAELEDVKTNSLSRSTYRNIRLPSERKIVLLNNMGNCCWNLYSRKNFRGGVRLHLSVDNSKIPDFALKSVKKVECK